ncbi:hypothetical protein V9T40_005040 [Parthenolecanium corni]|uniref:CCCTC-binding factor n=1 Tax=Parthenolecanium corni TaxID=536013 RepID=A0AAN9TDE5_9HEMI
MTETDPKTDNEPQTIKIEVIDRPPGSDDDNQESITDIQNYLQSFNKEIQTVQGESAESNNDGAATDVNNSETNTIYVTESGEYFYQADAVSGQVVTVVNNKELNAESSAAPTSTKKPSQKGSNAGNSANAAGDDGNKVVNDLSQASHIILGEDAFQTVTIVPTETNPGEVSYVLIVQQPDETEPVEKEEKDTDDAEDQDLTVYDFDDAEDPAASEAPESGEEEDKSKILKIVARKSQSVAQAHMCNYCNYTSPKRYLLSRHMKSHSEERPHKCSVCDRGFKTIASLQNHVNTHTGTKPHHCKFCSSAFTTSGELVRHVRYKHTHEKPHKCSICDYASVELSKMRNHMRCHTGERPYQCPHCTYASPDSFKLKRHLRIHTGERPYECDVCHARFTQSNSLKAHKLIHSDDSEKPVFKCDLCPATCGRKTDLRIHVQKLHTSDRMFTCRRCGKNFPDRYSYKIHNKSHEGEKCWKCDLCPYASTSSRHLESHMLIHTDQKPFRCSLCDQCFRQKQLLKRHQNLYHNPSYVPPSPREKTHECPECKRAFRHKGNLIRHMCMHDPDSEAIQTQNALKLGRQKKLQIVNGEELKIVPHEDDEEEDEDEDSMKEELEDTEEKVMKNELGSQLIEGADGQHYVVLEVIQLQGSDGEPAMAVVSDSDYQSGSIGIEDSNSVSAGQFITPDFAGNEKLSKSATSQAVKEIVEDACSDVQNCFGFDEEGEDEEMEEDLTQDERDLELCGEREVCSIVHKRLFYPKSVERFCRCADKECPSSWVDTPDNFTMYANNRAQMKFCEPITDLPNCVDNNETTPLYLTITNITLNVPPENEQTEYTKQYKISSKASCHCPQHHMWKCSSLETNSTTKTTVMQYRCASLDKCKAGNFCGSERSDFYSVYYYCSCPNDHFCVRNNDSEFPAREIFYDGPAYRAFCTNYPNLHSVTTERVN